MTKPPRVAATMLKFVTAKVGMLKERCGEDEVVLDLGIDLRWKESGPENPLIPGIASFLQGRPDISSCVYISLLSCDVDVVAVWQVVSHVGKLPIQYLLKFSGAVTRATVPLLLSRG